MDAQHTKPAAESATPLLGTAGWLSLAAAPTFAVMALMTAVGGSADPICAAAPDAFPLSGMAAMYALMCIFHVAPWLKLIVRRRSAARPHCLGVGGTRLESRHTCHSRASNRGAY